MAFAATPLRSPWRSPPSTPTTVCGWRRSYWREGWLESGLTP